MLRMLLPALTVLVAGQVQSVAQDRSGVLPPNNRYCLVQRHTDAVNCMFATMKQCLDSANVGREGECILNPALGPKGTEPHSRR